MPVTHRRMRICTDLGYQEIRSHPSPSRLLRDTLKLTWWQIPIPGGIQRNYRRTFGPISINCSFWVSLIFNFHNFSIAVMVPKKSTCTSWAMALDRTGIQWIILLGILSFRLAFWSQGANIYLLQHTVKSCINYSGRFERDILYLKLPETMA